LCFPSRKKHSFAKAPQQKFQQFVLVNVLCFHESPGPRYSLPAAGISIHEEEKQILGSSSTKKIQNWEEWQIEQYEPFLIRICFTFTLPW
jgi:hypothetical protein